MSDTLVGHSFQVEFSLLGAPTHSLTHSLTHCDFEGSERVSVNGGLCLFVAVWALSGWVTVSFKVSE